jgi:hypothetical protein
MCICPGRGTREASPIGNYFEWLLPIGQVFNQCRTLNRTLRRGIDARQRTRSRRFAAKDQTAKQSKEGTIQIYGEAVIRLTDGGGVGRCLSRRGSGANAGCSSGVEGATVKVGVEVEFDGNFSMLGLLVHLP